MSINQPIYQPTNQSINKSINHCFFTSCAGHPITLKQAVQRGPDYIFMNPFFSKSLQLSKTSTQFNLLLKLSNISFQLIKSNIQKIETNLSGISDSTYIYRGYNPTTECLSYCSHLYLDIYSFEKSLQALHSCLCE